MIETFKTKDYQQHKVFKQIDEYLEFYNALSFSMMNWMAGGTRAINFETYIFSSLEGTLQSIKAILENGRINDAFALLRKYYDGIIIHTYASQYLQDKFCIEEIIVKKIDDWLNGSQKIPAFKEMNEYIKKSEKLSAVNELLYADDKYNKIRVRCNSHVHYNFFQFMFLNDAEVYNDDRVLYLDMLSQDLKHIFIMHFIYTFTINDHYMSSSDYLDHLEMGHTPQDGLQYLVAPFIQDTFTNIIQKYRPDLARIMKGTTVMQLL